MQERQLFQGLIMAGGSFLLVKGLYMYCLWIINTLVYQGTSYSHNWLTPSLLIMMGILLMVGSDAITRFAYGDDYGQWSLSSIMSMGIKLLGIWLIYQQIMMLVYLIEYWRMNTLEPEMIDSVGAPYWIMQIVIGIAALAAGLALLRGQIRKETIGGGV